MDLHDQLKLYKHGYSKVTDHACREIRFGRLTREEGVALVRKYEQAPLKYEDKFCEWLGVTPVALQFILDQHRNPAYWNKNSHRNWSFAGWSTHHGKVEAETPELFEANQKLEYDRESEYITIGKGLST
jgi:hypothetical protein